MNEEPNLTEELCTCLEVLSEWLDWRTQYTRPIESPELTDPDEFELQAAIAGVLELVPELLDDDHRAWVAVMELRALVNSLQQITKPRGLTVPRVVLPNDKALHVPR